MYIVNRNKVFVWIILLVVCVLFLLVFLFTLLTWFFRESIDNNSQFMLWVSNNSIALQIIAFIISLIFGLMRIIFSKLDIFSENRDTIHNRVKIKYEKD